MELLKILRNLGVAIAAVLLLSGSLLAQDSLNVTKIAEIEWIWDEALDVVLSGNYAFVASGDLGLGVVDISDPSAPEPVGFCPTPGFSQAIFVAGDYAYLAADTAGLRIVDITDPSSPEEIGFYDSPNYTTSVLVEDSLAYVTDLSCFYILDVSNPALPLLLGANDTVDCVEGVARYGDYAFLPYGFNQSVWSFDVSNPCAPWNASCYQVGGPPSDIAISNGCAFVTNKFGTLHISDISNPLQPATLSNVGTDGMPEGITISGNHAFVANGAAGFQIFHVADPTAPALVGFYNTSGQAQATAVRGTYAYLADGDHFGIYDCSEALPVLGDNPQSVPTEFRIISVHPNPFNPTTTLTFSLPVRSFVKLGIFDVNGRFVGAVREPPLQGWPGWKPSPATAGTARRRSWCW